MGDLERAVMERLWATEQPPIGDPGREWHTVREVHGFLSAQRDVAYTTVLTVMDRLAKKGLVDRRRQGKAHGYRAVATRGAMTAGLMHEALAEFGRDDRATALVAFVGEATEEERTALRDALARLGHRDR